MTSEREEARKGKRRQGDAARVPAIWIRLVREDGAATLVEFGLIAMPFFLLLFAVFQQGLVFFEQQVFQTAITNAARLVYTGQASNTGMSQAQFKQAVCNQLPGFIPCSSVAINVQPYSDFSSTSITMPKDASGNYSTTQVTYNLGSPGSASSNAIVVVSGFAQLPVLFPMMNPYYSSTGTPGQVMITASAVFKNEPWQ